LEIGLLGVLFVVGGAVMGGAARTGLRMAFVSRAAHRALEIGLERCGVRAATNVGGRL